MTQTYCFLPGAKMTSVSKIAPVMRFAIPFVPNLLPLAPHCLFAGATWMGNLQLCLLKAGKYRPATCGPG